MRLHKITSTTIAILAIITATAYALAQEPTYIPELMGNAEYAALQERRNNLKFREDSLQRVIAQHRTEFSELSKRDSITMTHIEDYSNLILELEQQVFALRAESGKVSNQINNIEREWVLGKLSSAPDTSEDTTDERPIEEPVEESTEESDVQTPNETTEESGDESSNTTTESTKEQTAPVDKTEEQQSVVSEVDGSVDATPTETAKTADDVASEGNATERVTEEDNVMVEESNENNSESTNNPDKESSSTDIVIKETTPEIETGVESTIEQTTDNTHTAKPNKRNITHSEYFAQNLAESDIADLHRAHELEIGMVALGAEFNKTYDELSRLVNEYRQATEQEPADSILTHIYATQHRADSLSQIMEKSWTHIVDTKYYAYGYMLEKSTRYDLIDKSTNDFSIMQQQCSANDGVYISDALMHYAIGRPTLINFEIDVAQGLNLVEAQDSLLDVRKSLQVPEYRLMPISVERRIFLDLTPITIGRINFYNDNNPLPQLKIYEEGTIYRILLGVFKSKQPMTLFRGVQPLYITRNADGKYAYYAGGFATQLEADEARLFLKEKGFKAPEVCVWRDGEMTNITESGKASGSTAQEQIEEVRYMINIECETMDEAMRAAIEQNAPNKIISRSGAGFSVGVFTDRSEADAVVSTLTDLYPQTNIIINEIEM